VPSEQVVAEQELPAVLIDASVTPGGSESDTSTPVASDGPAFDTVIVQVAWSPAFTVVATAAFATRTSERRSISVVTVELLSELSGSAVVAATVAVFATDAPSASVAANVA
jgi:hypothetical protein